jgi:hypothetical protein
MNLSKRFGDKKVRNWGRDYLRASVSLFLASFLVIGILEIAGNFISQVHAQGENYSVRFYGHGVDDIDRIKIRINPPVPADIGSAHFTIEWWMKTLPGENTGTVSCNQLDGWITGNIIIDRDIYNLGDYGDFGVALNSGKLAFGISQGNSGTTICGATNIANGIWHHIAVTRNSSTGQIVIFVDGIVDGQGIGPTGDVSYRDDRTSNFPNDPYLVLGAEKHDAGSSYPSYSGWMDDLRFSNSIRYSGSFTKPSTPFTTDGNTAALYHFDEGPVGACAGSILDLSGASGGPSNGACRYGGVGTSGPVYQADTPFLDNNPPVITNIIASPLDKNAIINWSTNEPSSSKVVYGETSPVTETPLDGKFVVSHSVVLAGLQPDTGYVFVVQSKDPSGNSSVSTVRSFRTLLTSQTWLFSLPHIRR